MILLLLLIFALMLAWGLTDMQLSAPIERPEPPPPVIAKPVPPPVAPELPQAEPALPESGELQPATPPDTAVGVEPTTSPVAPPGYSLDK